MLHGLNTLEDFNKSQEPGWLEQVWFFFLENGVSWEEFNRLPLPYIFSILRVNQYQAEQQEKRMKQ